MKNGTTPHTSSIISRHFESLDEVAAFLPVWGEMELVQTEPGTFDASATVARTTNCILTHVTMGRKFHYRGLTPVGYRTFTIPACEQREFLAHREWVNHNQIVLGPASCETNGMAYAGLNLFHLSVTDEDLESIGRMADVDMETAIAGDGVIFTPDPDAVNSLREMLWDVQNQSQQSQQATWFPAAAEMLKDALATCLATTVEQKSEPAPKRRDHVFKTVLKYMMANLDTIVSVKDLCREGNVSDRTLLYIFRERLDVTPKEFLQACKLRKVQQDLLSGEAKSVTDAATRWGFWHMGQFAADYRKMFGELPSAILKRRK